MGCVHRFLEYGHWLVIICDSYVASVLHIEVIKYFIVFNHDNYPNNEFISKTKTLAM